MPAPAAAPPPPRQRPQASATPRLGNSLADIVQIKAQEAPAALAAAEEPASYQLNPAISLPEADFRRHLGEYVAQLQAANRMTLASILEECPSTLEHNRWRVQLHNELQQQILDRDRTQVLPFLRERLRCPELFLEIQLDEAAAPAPSTSLYTPEEKLRELSRRYPELQKLQEIFNTRIIY